MIFTWIAVALVAGLMIGFVTLSVVWTARTVNRNIRDRSIELLSTYDGLLDEKSRELSALRRELEQAREELAEMEKAKEPAAVMPTEEPPAPAPTIFLRAAERISTTSYQDTGAGQLYRKVREAFSQTPETVVSALPAEPAAEALEGAFASLAPETIYRLSTLPEDEQLALLDELLPDGEHAALAEYVALHGRFDAISFYDELRSRAVMESGTVLVRVPNEVVAAQCPRDVLVEVDEDICEGFQVEADNVLYDYAIKTREIG